VAISQNGYTAARSAAGIPSGVIRIRPKGADRATSAFTVRRDIAAAFQYLIDAYQARVEDIDLYAAGDDWSYVYRDVRGGGALSNHASATAIDINATRHPLGVPTGRGFTAAQIAEVHQILRELKGVIRWGGDYRNRPDAMHFEIDAAPAAVKAAVAGLNRTDEGDDMATPQEIWNDVDITLGPAEHSPAWYMREILKITKAANARTMVLAGATEKILAKLAADDPGEAQLQADLAAVRAELEALAAEDAEPEAADPEQQ
jgi:hypothetical protein